jgi:hypothetical protein
VCDFASGVLNEVKAVEDSANVRIDGEGISAE